MSKNRIIKAGVIPIEQIESKIFLVRNQKVMLDADLADLYNVPTRRLNEQVKRNIDRFPEDFMFQLSKPEYESLRSQIAISKRGGRRYLPYAFTEQGVAMLSSVLNSEKAIEVNIRIMRIFSRLRQMVISNKEFELKLVKLERKLKDHDENIQTIFEAIRQMMIIEEKPKRRIGFHR